SLIIICHPLTAAPPLPLRSALFPYTTLFRSSHRELGRSCMDIVVKGRNVEVPEHYRMHVSDKLARLERYDRKIIRFDVELFHERSEEHTSELQSRENRVCRLLLEEKKERLRV